MKNWYVAHTQPNKECIAEQHLREQGFEVYMPRFKKIRRHARKVDKVLSPLFPRYIFVAMDIEIDHWRCVNGTRGIIYLLVNDNNPISVPTQIIDRLKEQENAEGLVLVNSISLFTKGDPIRVLEGAFKDYSAVFESLDDKQRVQLLLTFLGREMKISLPLYAVEAA